jgi:integrase
MLCQERKPGNGQTHKPGGRSTGTVNRYLAALQAAFSLAVRNAKVEKNPLTQVKLKKENNCRVRWLTQEEEGRLLAVLPVECHAMVKVALHTRLRRTEQFGLLWADLNFQQRFITVRESKSGESRTVPMNDIVYRTLQRLPRMLNNPFVFPGTKPQTDRTDLPKGWEISDRSRNHGFSLARP